MKAFEFTTPLKAQKPIQLALMSDLHIDSPNFDEITFREHANYCIESERYILFGGDIFDGILRTDTKRAVNSLLESGDNQLNIKLDKAYELLKPYKNRILFIGRGNHEESILKYNGVDVIEILVKMLNADQKNQIVVGNYANFIRFGFTDNRNRITAHYDIYQHHGMGGSAPVTKGMIDFNRIAKGVDADLIWIAHKHQSVIDASDPLMFVNKNGEVVLKNRQCVMTPSYQKGRTIDPNINFAERMYSHTALSGFGELDLIPYYKDNVLKINSRLRITIKPQAILGNIVSAKLNQRVR